jgi:nucleotide-binding universal stress UspA family protein
VLLYDGAPSSVYAIRQFSYLLSGLASLPVTVLTIAPPEKSLHVPDNRLMKELMKRHWPHAEYEVHHGLAEEEIIRQLAREDEGTLVVLGAYRRGNLSRWFRESMADILMRETKLPLFVAHN